ncbi:hypothetical protein GLE_5426 [Lysobacter enzymogenes]|uniref:Uncharacterized protein n=1 Tax=Lysobacter enzymogenes TaxID=69 RepID=A0A0S2DR19_LYSEN|nr:hypothetical protein GLE_5426 [Lysobacter enzymogenes]
MPCGGNAGAAGPVGRVRDDGRGQCGARGRRAGNEKRRPRAAFPDRRGRGGPRRRLRRRLT